MFLQTGKHRPRYHPGVPARYVLRMGAIVSPG
jgi:hypothetical protein